MKQSLICETDDCPSPKKDDPLTMLNNYTHIKVCFKRNCARIVKLKINLCGTGAGGRAFTMVKHKL